MLRQILGEVIFQLYRGIARKPSWTWDSCIHLVRYVTALTQI